MMRVAVTHKDLPLHLYSKARSSWLAKAPTKHKMLSTRVYIIKRYITNKDNLAYVIVVPWVARVYWIHTSARGFKPNTHLLAMV